MISCLMRGMLWLLMALFVAGCAAQKPVPSPQASTVPVIVKTETPKAPEPTTETAMVNASRLNLREDATTDSRVIEVLNKAEILTVLSRQGDWAAVKTVSGQQGWVAARFLSVPGAAPGAKGPTVRAADAGTPSQTHTGFLSREDALALYGRFRKALAGGDFGAFLSVVYVPKKAAGKTAAKDPGEDITSESFAEMKDFVLELSPNPAVCRLLKFDSSNQAAIVVFQSDLKNTEYITLSAVMMAQAEDGWKVMPGSYDDTFPRKDPSSDKAAIAEKLKTNPELQLAAVTAKIAAKAAPDTEPPPEKVPAAAGEAEGELVVNGEATALKYAYAYEERGFFDKNKMDTVVILSNIALDDEGVNSWGRRAELEQAGKLRCVELTINADGQVISRKVRHSAFKASPSGVSSTEVFEPLATGEGIVAGKAYSTKEGEFFGVTFRYQASFRVQVRPSAKPGLPMRPPLNARWPSAIHPSTRPSSRCWKPKERQRSCRRPTRWG